MQITVDIENVSNPEDIRACLITLVKLFDSSMVNMVGHETKKILADNMGRLLADNYINPTKVNKFGLGGKRFMSSFISNTMGSYIMNPNDIVNLLSAIFKYTTKDIKYHTEFFDLFAYQMRTSMKYNNTLKIYQIPDPINTKDMYECFNNYNEMCVRTTKRPMKEVKKLTRLAVKVLNNVDKNLKDGGLSSEVNYIYTIASRILLFNCMNNIPSNFKEPHIYYFSRMFNSKKFNDQDNYSIYREKSYDCYISKYLNNREIYAIYKRYVDVVIVNSRLNNYQLRRNLIEVCDGLDFVIIKSDKRTKKFCNACSKYLLKSLNKAYKKKTSKKAVIEFINTIFNYEVYVWDPTKRGTSNWKPNLTPEEIKAAERVIYAPNILINYNSELNSYHSSNGYFLQYFKDYLNDLLADEKLNLDFKQMIFEAKLLK